MADIVGSALDKVAGLLGAKSGKQLGMENKKKAADDATAKAKGKPMDRSTAGAMQQSQDTMDAAMKELNLQNKRYAPGELPGSK